MLRLLLLVILAAGLLFALLRSPATERPSLLEPERSERSAVLGTPTLEVALPQEKRQRVRGTGPPEDVSSAPSQAGEFEPVDYRVSGAFTRAPMGLANAIHGRVVAGASPVVGAPITAWRPPKGQTIGPADDIQHRTTSDENGYFTIAPVDIGRWAVGAEAAGASTSGGLKVGPAGEANRGVLLLFGQSAILVDVRDDIGTSLVNVPISINGVGPAPARSRHLATNSEGLARFDALVAGRYYVQATRAGLGVTEAMVVLEPGQERTVLIGNDAPPSRWTGRVVDGAGDPVELGVNLRLVHAERRDERWLLINGATFEIDLPPGSWEVWRRGQGFTLRDRLATVEVSARDLKEDITLPGVRLILEVDGALENCPITLVAKADSSSDRSALEPDRVDGQIVQFFNVSPGAHHLEIGGSGRWSKLHSDASKNGLRLPQILKASEPVYRRSVSITHSERAR